MNDSPGDCQSRDLTEPAGETLSAELTEGAGGMNEIINGGLLPSRLLPRTPKI
ncbi:MAG: hypothetical protein IJS45_06065 [Clostridia bacterium]|nr:hypothetical protein [Clostridia bacterium]